MESFTIELVSNASAQLFPDITLSSFTNFLQFTVKVSRRTQKVEIYLANEGSGLAFFITDL